MLEKLVEQLIVVMNETQQDLNYWLLQENRYTSQLTDTPVGLGKDLPETEEQLFELAQYPLVDIAKGMEISATDEDGLAEYLRIMSEEIPHDKEQLMQAYAENNWEQIEKLAHRAKGGTDYSGTIRMKYACMYLERYRKAGHSVSLEQLYHQLIQVLDETQEYIKHWLRERH